MKLNSSLAIKAADWLSQNFQKSMGEEWQKKSLQEGVIEHFDNGIPFVVSE